MLAEPAEDDEMAAVTWGTASGDAPVRYGSPTYLSAGGGWGDAWGDGAADGGSMGSESDLSDSSEEEEEEGEDDGPEAAGVTRPGGGPSAAQPAPPEPEEEDVFDFEEDSVTLEKVREEMAKRTAAVRLGSAPTVSSQQMPVWRRWSPRGAVTLPGGPQPPSSPPPLPPPPSLETRTPPTQAPPRPQTRRRPSALPRFVPRRSDAQSPPPPSQPPLSRHPRRPTAPRPRRPTAPRSRRPLALLRVQTLRPVVVTFDQRAEQAA